jgi:hypothetical protein
MILTNEGSREEVGPEAFSPSKWNSIKHEYAKVYGYRPEIGSLNYYTSKGFEQPTGFSNP